MPVKGKHQILLANFSATDAESLRKRGYNVERGYVGRLESTGKERAIPYFFPHPVYEYDVYVYNSVLDDDEAWRREFSSVENLLSGRTPNALEGVHQTFRIVFTGGSSGIPRLSLGGLDELETTVAHGGVSAFETTAIGSFCVPEIHNAIGRLKNSVLLPVGEYFRWAETRSYPVHHIPVLVTKNGDEVAAYGAMYDEASNKPIYIVLPQDQNNARALASILDALVEVRPDLFPDKSGQTWFRSGEFTFKEEREVEDAIRAKIAETEAFIDAKQAEKNKIDEAFGFIRRILVATEQAPELENRLSSNVKKTLEYLGFSVDDIDEKVKGAIRKEDFWVADGDFLAITEVTGTVRKNPKPTEFSSLLGRLATIYKRRDLVPNAERVSGLLIVNHDLNTHPQSRPALYSGNEEVVDAAEEQSIGLISSVELFKIAIAVKDGDLTPEAARELLKKAGLIEVGTGDANEEAEMP